MVNQDSRPLGIPSESPPTQVGITHSEAIEAILSNGTTVKGTLWTLPSGVGKFEVEFNGRRISDGRSDYSNKSELKAIARTVLRELAEK